MKCLDTVWNSSSFSRKKWEKPIKRRSLSPHQWRFLLNAKRSSPNIPIKITQINTVVLLSNRPEKDSLSLFLDTLQSYILSVYVPYALWYELGYNSHQCCCLLCCYETVSKHCVKCASGCDDKLLWGAGFSRLTWKGAHQGWNRTVSMLNKTLNIRMVERLPINL